MSLETVTYTHTHSLNISSYQVTTMSYPQDMSKCDMGKLGKERQRNERSKRNQGFATPITSYFPLLTQTWHTTTHTDTHTHTHRHMHTHKPTTTQHTETELSLPEFPGREWWVSAGVFFGVTFTLSTAALTSCRRAWLESSTGDSTQYSSKQPSCD